MNDQEQVMSDFANLAFDYDAIFLNTAHSLERFARMQMSINSDVDKYRCGFFYDERAQEVSFTELEGDTVYHNDHSMRNRVTEIEAMLRKCNCRFDLV